jgi:hypothetical protein
MIIDTRDIETKRHYWVWAAMLDRCRNPNNKQYKDYGGRGIYVCPEWYDFSVFLAQMGKRPSRDYTLERKNNDKGYSPDNCEWAPRGQQAKNKRKYSVCPIGVTGVCLVLQRYRARIRVDGKLIHLGYFGTLQEAAEARAVAAKANGFSPKHGW